MTLCNSHLYEKSVSVIIPCFNAENWIIKAIKSVENQIIQPIEIIIVDDGSTDDTLNVAQNYSSSIPISIYTQKNSGPASARNYGVMKSSGFYVSFLDADDEWAELRLSAQLNIIDPNSFSTSNCELIDEFSNVIGANINRFPMSNDKLVKSLYLGKVSMLTPGLIIPKDKFLKVGGFDTSLRYKEDHLLVLKLICIGLKLNYVNENLFKVRVHSNSGRNTVNEDLLWESFINFSRKAIDVCNPLISYEKEFKSELYFILMKSYLGRSPIKAIHYSIKSFLMRPSFKKLLIVIISPFPISKERVIRWKSKIIG